MSCDNQCSVALLQSAVVSLQCMIVVFPDHTHLVLGIIGRPTIELLALGHLNKDFPLTCKGDTI